MEEIKLNGNFAVKIGEMWAKKTYDGIGLKDYPEALVSFTEALALSKKTGGKVVMFKPVEISDEKIEELKLAAEMKNESV